MPPTPAGLFAAILLRGLAATASLSSRMLSRIRTKAASISCYGVRGHAGVINDAARAGRPGNVIPISNARGPQKEFNL